MEQVTETEVRRMISDAAIPLRDENDRLRRQLGIPTDEEAALQRSLIQENLEGIADVMVGPRLDKRTASKADRKLRDNAREAFLSGRAGFREGRF